MLIGRIHGGGLKTESDTDAVCGAYAVDAVMCEVLLMNVWHNEHIALSAHDTPERTQERSLVIREAPRVFGLPGSAVPTSSVSLN